MRNEPVRVNEVRAVVFGLAGEDPKVLDASHPRRAREHFAANLFGTYGTQWSRATTSTTYRDPSDPNVKLRVTHASLEPDNLRPRRRDLVDLLDDRSVFKDTGTIMMIEAVGRNATVPDAVMSRLVENVAVGGLPGIETDTAAYRSRPLGMEVHGVIKTNDGTTRLIHDPALLDDFLNERGPRTLIAHFGNPGDAAGWVNSPYHPTRGMAFTDLEEASVIYRNDGRPIDDGDIEDAISAPGRRVTNRLPMAAALTWHGTDADTKLPGPRYIENVYPGRADSQHSGRPNVSFGHQWQGEGWYHSKYETPGPYDEDFDPQRPDLDREVVVATKMSIQWNPDDQMLLVDTHDQGLEFSIGQFRTRDDVEAAMDGWKDLQYDPDGFNTLLAQMPDLPFEHGVEPVIDTGEMTLPDAPDLDVDDGLDI